MSNGAILGSIAGVIGALVLFFTVIQPWLRTCSVCGRGTYPGGTMKADAWFIGPRQSWFAFFRPGNQSRGMPVHPTATSEGWIVNVPVGVNLPLKTGGKLDATLFRHGSLTGRTSIKARIRVTGGHIYAVPETPGLEGEQRLARITPQIQRVGDDLTMDGAKEAYRWDYTAQDFYLNEGEQDIVVPLNEGWTGMDTSTIANNPEGFKAAIDNAGCVGFVYGGNEIGRGHGVRAASEATVEVLSFEVV